MEKFIEVDKVGNIKVNKCKDVYEVDKVSNFETNEVHKEREGGEVTLLRRFLMVR